MPKATPQTATRKIRSQSPPQRTQRIPVSAMQAAIASSSISPYMWIESGPTWTTPVCGEGMYASRVTRQDSADDRSHLLGLQQDLEREIGRAAALDQPDRRVEVDVMTDRELGRLVGQIARPLELLQPPSLYQLGLLENRDLCRSAHSLSSPPIFVGRRQGLELPKQGDLRVRSGGRAGSLGPLRPVLRGGMCGRRP